MKTIFTFTLAILLQTTVFSQVTSFNNKVNNDRIDLNWATASEKNISHFIIEKSFDGKNYTQAGLVFAYGNTTETKVYPFFEMNVKGNAAGVLYYRVLSVNEDGTASALQTTTVIVGTNYDRAVGSIR